MEARLHPRLPHLRSMPAFTCGHSHRLRYPQSFGVGWMGEAWYLEGGGIDWVEHAEAIISVRLVVAVDLHESIGSSTTTSLILLSFHNAMVKMHHNIFEKTIGGR